MPAKRKPKPRKNVEVVGFLGVGLDNEDGHCRLTTAENFLLVGGSHETHDRMIDTAIHVNEGLRKKGRRLEDASLDEILDLFREAAS